MSGAKRAPSSSVKNATASGRCGSCAGALQRLDHLEPGEHAEVAVVAARRCERCRCASRSSPARPRRPARCRPRCRSRRCARRGRGRASTTRRGRARRGRRRSAPGERTRRPSIAPISAERVQARLQAGCRRRAARRSPWTSMAKVTDAPETRVGLQSPGRVRDRCAPASRRSGWCTPLGRMWWDDGRDGDHHRSERAWRACTPRRSGAMSSCHPARRRWPTRPEPICSAVCRCRG